MQFVDFDALCAHGQHLRKIIAALDQLNLDFIYRMYEYSCNSLLNSHKTLQNKDTIPEKRDKRSLQDVGTF